MNSHFYSVINHTRVKLGNGVEGPCKQQKDFFKIFIAQKVSNIHLVTKDFKIVPLTNLLKLLLAWRVVGGGVCHVRFILRQQ